MAGEMWAVAELKRGSEVARAGGTPSHYIQYICADDLDNRWTA